MMPEKSAIISKKAGQSCSLNICLNSSDFVCHQNCCKNVVIEMHWNISCSLPYLPHFLDHKNARNLADEGGGNASYTFEAQIQKYLLRREVVQYDISGYIIP